MKIRNNGNWEYRKLRKMKIQKMQIWKIAIWEKWKLAKVKSRNIKIQKKGNRILEKLYLRDNEIGENLSWNIKREIKQMGNHEEELYRKWILGKRVM